MKRYTERDCILRADARVPANKARYGIIRASRWHRRAYATLRHRIVLRDVTSPGSTMYVVHTQIDTGDGNFAFQSGDYFSKMSEARKCFFQRALKLETSYAEFMED